MDWIKIMECCYRRRRVSKGRVQHSWKQKNIDEKKIVPNKRMQLFAVSKDDAFAPERFSFRGEQYSGIIYFGLLQKKELPDFTKSIMLRYAVQCHNKGLKVAVPLAFFNRNGIGVIASAVKSPVPLSYLSGRRFKGAMEGIIGKRKVQKLLKQAQQNKKRTLHLLHRFGIELDDKSDNSFSTDGELLKYTKAELHYKE